jgi:cell division protein FtsQ
MKAGFKIKFKKILTISLWTILVAGILVLVGFMNAEHRKLTCKDIEISIDLSGGDQLISEARIRKIIRQDTLIDKKLTDIDIVRIENRLNKIGVVSKADVYTTLTGNLNIRIRQCRPLVRVYNTSGQSYYIDMDGKLAPESPGFPANVPIATGFIKTHYSDTLNVLDTNANRVLKDLYQLSGFIFKDEFLKAQIEQIYVTQDREFELIPRVGKHIIVFGSIEKMEEKFENLLLFYHEGLNKTGWNKYGVINLKFENQVVCTKK